MRRVIGDASTQELRDELEKRGLDTSGLKGQLVERLEEALAGEGAGEGEDELEDVPDVEVSAADAAKLAELEKKEPAAEAKTPAGAAKKDLPKPKPTEAERKKAQAERKAEQEKIRAEKKAAYEKAEAERKAAAEKAKKEADEAFVKDLERRKERAERFKLPFALSEQEKTRIRNVGAEKKFGFDNAENGANGTAAPKEKTAEEKAKDTADFEAKLKARAERFGDALKPLPKPTPMFAPKRPGGPLPGAPAPKVAK